MGPADQNAIFLSHKGLNPVDVAFQPTTDVRTDTFFCSCPTARYDFIVPLKEMTFAGVAWYQGEANDGGRPDVSGPDRYACQ